MRYGEVGSYNIRVERVVNFCFFLPFNLPCGFPLPPPPPHESCVRQACNSRFAPSPSPRKELNSPEEYRWCVWVKLQPTPSPAPFTQLTLVRNASPGRVANHVANTHTRVEWYICHVTLRRLMRSDGPVVTLISELSPQVEMRNFVIKAKNNLINCLIFCFQVGETNI